MSTTAPNPNHRSLPRQKRPPRSRDFAILIAYKTRGCSQADLAREYRLSQRRISAIIHKVESWIATSPTCNLEPETRNASDPHAQLRLDRWLERERNQSIYDRALRAHDHSPTELTSTVTYSKSSVPGSSLGPHYPEAPASSPPPNLKPETSNSKPDSPNLKPETSNMKLQPNPDSFYRVESARQPTPSAQFLRVALQASRELAQLAEKEPPPPPPSPEKDDRRRALIMHQVLCQLRREVEEQGLVAKSRDHVVTVDQWLAALLGQKPSWINPDDIAEGAPLSELAHFYTAPEPPQPEASNPELDTAVPASNCSNSSNPTASDTPDFAASPSIQNQKSKIQNLARQRTSDPQSNSADRDFAARLRRRQAHQEKLELFYDLARRGLPIQLQFDPADGPLPSLSHHLDDPSCSPPPPNKQEESQLVRDHLSRLRTEKLSNA